jgi:hypothetical protein
VIRHNKRSNKGTYYSVLGDSVYWRRGRYFLNIIIFRYGLLILLLYRLQAYIFMNNLLFFSGLRLLYKNIILLNISVTNLLT